MPQNLNDLLALVQNVMQLCAQTTTRAGALESLIRKGVVTEAELQQETEEVEKNTRKLADALGSFGETPES